MIATMAKSLGGLCTRHRKCAGPAKSTVVAAAPGRPALTGRVAGPKLNNRECDELARPGGACAARVSSQLRAGLRAVRTVLRGWRRAGDLGPRPGARLRPPGSAGDGAGRTRLRRP